MVQYCTHKSPASVPVLSHINPVNVVSLLIEFSYLHYPPTYAVPSNWSLSLRFLHQNPLYTSPPYVLRAPPHLSSFDRPINIWRGIQEHKLHQVATQKRKHVVKAMVMMAMINVQ